MKVCVIFTGGTIGSKVGENGRIATSDDLYRLIQQYWEQSGSEEDIEFFTEEPYNILSENLQADHILCLADTVKTVLNGQTVPDGIIITHGTDTIQYTAAILQYLLGGYEIPILLISSDYVLDDKRANGPDNFRYALDVVRHRRGEGVFVVFRNHDGQVLLHRGTRMRLPIAYSADMLSILDSWYGRYVNGVYEKNAAYRVDEKNRKAMFAKGETVTLLKDSAAILRIRPYVGMQYPRISDETKAVLFESFHSGTISIDEKLKDFMQTVRERDIPAFLIGLPEAEAEYETVDMYRKLGICPLRQGAVIAQYCKLWLAISNGLELQDVMQTPMAEDFA